MRSKAHMLATLRYIPNEVKERFKKEDGSLRIFDLISSWFGWIGVEETILAKHWERNQELLK